MISKTGKTCLLPVAVIINCQKLCGLKQWKILLLFWRLEVKSHFTKRIWRCWQVWFLLEVLGGNPFSHPSQLLEVTCIPCLMAPNFIFRVHHPLLSIQHHITKAATVNRTKYLRRQGIGSLFVCLFASEDRKGDKNGNILF